MGENTYSPYIQTGKWYSFEIELQFREDQVKIGIVYKYSLLTFFLQWRNRFIIKDDMDQEILNLIIFIPSPEAFVDVSVFASDNFYKPAEAIIKSFHFSSGTYSC